MRRDEGPKLQRVGLLAKIPWLLEDRPTCGLRQHVFHKRHAAILIPHNQIDVAIGIPVDRGGRDHLQVHGERLAIVGGQLEARRILRLPARADVLEVGEAVEKLTAEQIEVAVAIEVGEVGARRAIDINRRATSKDFLRCVGIHAIHIFNQIHPAMQWAVAPATLGVERLIPDVVAPVADADDEILIAIPLPVDKSPHAGPRVACMEAGVGIDLHPALTGGASLAKPWILDVLPQHPRRAIDLAHLHVVAGGPQPNPRLEDRHRLGRILRRILEIPQPV